MFDLTRSEVRSRSLVGAFYITFSGFANLLIGFFGSLALARMLTPSDFGIVAIGLTVTILGGALADGGLGSGMVRRPESPSRSELRTITGIQLTIAFAFSVPVAAIALAFFGQAGAVTALMVMSLPIATLQAPGRIVLARRVRFDRQAAVDFGAQTSFYAFSVAAVALGAGVWGLAAGSVVKTLAGVVLQTVLSIGLLMPSLRGWRGYGELVRFGLRFQATWLTFVAREQCLNAVVAVIAGASVLGLWYPRQQTHPNAVACSDLALLGRVSGNLESPRPRRGSRTDRLKNRSASRDHGSLSVCLICGCQSRAGPGALWSAME